MSVAIETQLPRRLDSANPRPRGRVFPSPADWRDQFLYFLLPDRFSDGAEGSRCLFHRSQPARYHAPNKREWMEGGVKFQGGTLNGVKSHLGYLQDLGVTAIWLGPVWRQRPDLETYHGYGIQNFLDVDPRFGSRQDLRDLVDAAHDRGMYVLLDIIYNHTGDNWFYEAGGAPTSSVVYRFSPPYQVHGWRAGDGRSTPQIQSLGDGVWPEEFQQWDWYTRAGKIGRWDPAAWEDAMHPDNEFRRGDFETLKNLELHSRALNALVDVYRYWIALSDCDGFRIDTVKHVPFEASRNFCGGIHEYAESIGKDNFLLLGEVTGGAGMARNYLDVFGRNLDAALDLGDPAAALSGMVKGFRHPDDFFCHFGGHDELGSHREVGRYLVSMYNDHDMVGQDRRRFCAGNAGSAGLLQVAHATGVQLTTLGIPCLYYGSEQAFDGSPDRHDFSIQPRDSNGKIPDEDRYLRESMFGGTFGAYETTGCHFFDPDHPSYLRIAAIARLRARRDAIGLTLRRGRQYRREISFMGLQFVYPGQGELIAWSRLLYQTEVLVCLNTQGEQGRGALVTVDAGLHSAGSSMTVLYRADWSDVQLRQPPTETVAVEDRGGRSVVRVDLPPAGMAILA